MRRPMRFADDVQLVAQVRAGSRGAFEAIYDRHHAGILSFCRHMLGSPEEAEDVLQQTFAAAYSALLANERDIALKPWLYAIARNGCLSALRVHREHVALDDADGRLPATVGLSIEVEQREDLRALLRDLQRLPEDQRAALILAELGAESHEEIALVLGVPAVKVRALIFQAREALMSRRLGREADCGPIREQLACLRGGARRRRELRQHVSQCAGCQAFEAETSRQRAGMAVLLPVAPTLALKQSSLAAAFAAGGSSAAKIGGAAASGAAAGTVTAGGVSAGGMAAGGVGGAYSVVGGAVAGGSAAAGGAAAGSAATIGGVAVLSGGGVLVGAKLVGLKALVGMALTGVTAGGYTAVQPADHEPAPAAQVASSVANQGQKAGPKPPPAGVVAPATVDNCRGPGAAGANAAVCAAKGSGEPLTAGAATGTRPGESAAKAEPGDRDGDGVPNTQDSDTDGDGLPNSQDGVNAPANQDPAAAPASQVDDRDGDGVPNTQDADRDGDGIANNEDRCPNRPGNVNGCPEAAAAAPFAPSQPGDRDGDGVPNTQDADRDGDGVANNEDRCPNRPGTVDGCPVTPAAPADPAPTTAPAPRDPDGDGIPNGQDEDRDGDGVPNLQDRCPNRPGTVFGCPVAPVAPTSPAPAPAPGPGPGPDPVPSVPVAGDRDGDGVPNREDNCPAEPGPGDGCPDVLNAIAGDPTPGDRDGDGIPNGKDRDRDGDGLVNRDDACPNRAGMIDGCSAAQAPGSASALPATPAAP
ncbi:MAG TPA: sigma-70 family RNA polymerase sigma factor [Solirubrobacteraceae bacterium]|nr:sigma-70 family RNA polymerase sigma factor [Solirubrobacteraceae bacterium]